MNTMSHNTYLEAPPSAHLESCEDLGFPLSPTSSVRGCFVRSRPTSALSDCNYPDFSGITDCVNPAPISNQQKSASTIPTTDDIIETADRWVHSQVQGHGVAAANSDTRSLAASTYTTGSRVRIVRRSDAEVDAELAKLARDKQQAKDQQKYDVTGGDKNATSPAARRRTWPSYKAIRKTASSIFHRRESPTISPNGGKAIMSPGPATEKIKPSTSFLAKRRRATVTSIGDKSDDKPSRFTLSSRTRAANGTLRAPAQLRRSRSFSGFTSVLTAIDDAGDDDDLDEVTTEARGLVEDIRRRWAFEEVPEADGGNSVHFGTSVFERLVN